MPISVNFYDKVIYITSPTSSVTIQELVDAIRLTEDSADGIGHGESVATLANAIADAEGKVDVGSGYRNPTTMTLANTWYIEFWNGVSLGTVAGGNITGGLGGRPVRAAVGSADTVLVLGAERGIEVSSGTSAETIADAVWDEDRADHTSAGTYGATDEWSGDVDEAAIADAVWDESIADHLGGDKAGQHLEDADATADTAAVADAVWDEARSGHATPGSYGAVDEWAGEVDEAAIAAEVDTTLSSSHGSGNWEGAGAAADIADAVWDETLADHMTPGTTGKKLYDGGTGDPAEIAQAVWDALSADYQVEDTMGAIMALLKAGALDLPRILPGDGD